MRSPFIVGFALAVSGALTPATLRADCKIAFSSSTPPPQTTLQVASTSGRFVESSPTADYVSALAASTGSSAQLFRGERNLRTIVRSNLDGSGAQIVVQHSQTPLSIAVSGGFLYWSSTSDAGGSTDGGIFRAALDGSSTTQLVSNIAAPYGLSFGANGRMYWVSTTLDQSASIFRGSIWSALADGTDITQVADLTALIQQFAVGFGHSLPRGLAIDRRTGELYVSDNLSPVHLTDRIIWKLDADGKNGRIFARFPGGVNAEVLHVLGPNLLADVALDSERPALFVVHSTLYSASAVFRLPTDTDVLPYNYGAATNDPRDLHRYRIGLSAEHLALIGPEQGVCNMTKTLSGSSESDYIVWRPKLGQWFALGASTNSSASLYTRQWGLPGDVPLAANFDGDAALDMTVWRRNEGRWYACDWQLSGECSGTFASQWGLPDDFPLVTDFNGDGLSDLTVWRPSNGTWYFRVSEGGEARIRQWGLPGDIPLNGDFNMDGRDDFVVFRPSFGLWFVLYSSFEGDTPGADAMMVRQWGLPGDLPLVGDYDGDSRPDLVAWRPPTGMWYFCLSSKQYECKTQGVERQFGLPGDYPIRGDFDGDGLFDTAVWRPSSGNWYVHSSLSDQMVVRQWGLPGDIPLDAGTYGNGPAGKP